jgi:ATP-dependent Lon protease
LNTRALVGLLSEQVGAYASLVKGFPEDVDKMVRHNPHPGQVADLVTLAPDFTPEERLATFAELDVAARVKYVLETLSAHVRRLSVVHDVQSTVQKGMEDSQRKYYLREQLKAIRKELGEDDEQTSEAEGFKKRVEASLMPTDIKERALGEVKRLEQMPAGSPEISYLTNYLDWLLRMPWGVETPDCLDLKEAEAVLEADHYGLKDVKERILEFLAVRKLTDQKRGTILALIGPPGVGKTSLGKSVARAMGRKFVRMSLGGVRDEAEIRGHRRTYVGALPGRIAQALATAGSMNPVFVLDEIDKVGADQRGDPSSALLEVLDPEQNNTFADHYLEVPLDLSNVIFIATANVAHTIPAPLRDRMEVITIAGYTEEEKAEIARRHLVPKVREQHGLAESQFRVTRDALRLIAREYTREAGVRNLERELASLCRKAAAKVARGDVRAVSIGAGDLEKWLGPARMMLNVAEQAPQVGVATGVAVSEAGGEIMPIEVAVMEGRREPLVTGSLGDVMRESALAAWSYARVHAGEWQIQPSRFENYFVHLHVPAGGVPKDGPSAGVAMVTALVSALSERPVRADVAMTGEITLRGRVLPIGGLKEKVLAAQRAGITTFIHPRSNQAALAELPKELVKGMRFVAVDYVDEALRVALVDGESLRLAA